MMKKLSLLFLLIISFSCIYAQIPEMSDEQYFRKYIEELDYTQSFLKYINAKNPFAKMGTETIEGTISGTLFYTVNIKGIGAEVILRYTNFSVKEGWTFDGDIIVVSNMNQDGPLAGTITVTGEQPGKVYYDNVSMKKGLPAAGYYGVEQQNKNLGKVPYTVYLDCKKNNKK